jgi:hypothetical protein
MKVEVLLLMTLERRSCRELRYPSMSCRELVYAVKLSARLIRAGWESELVRSGYRYRGDRAIPTWMPSRVTLAYKQRLAVVDRYQYSNRMEATYRYRNTFKSLLLGHPFIATLDTRLEVVHCIMSREREEFRHRYVIFPQILL